jgi:hypothetical protein
MRQLVLALFVCATCNTAHAMTGAEFLQSSRLFAYGYLTGVIDMRVTVIHPDDEHFMTIRNCVIEAKLSNETLYNVLLPGCTVILTNCATPHWARS